MNAGTQAVDAFKAFMAAHRVQPGEDFTHTSLDHPRGSFFIAAQDMKAFFQLYCAASRYSCAGITEKHKSFSPILIDLDLRQQAGARLYSPDTVHGFVNAVAGYVAKYVCVPSFTAYIQEKPQPRRNKDAGYKDGVHVVIPDVVTCPALQYVIRKQFIEDHGDLLSALPGVTNSIQDIYDECVIEKNNWFLYGSKKPDDTHPWTVTRVLHFTVRDHQVASCEDKPFTANDPHLVELLSIRYNVHEECRYTPAAKQAMATLQRAPPPPPPRAAAWAPVPLSTQAVLAVPAPTRTRGPGSTHSSLSVPSTAASAFTSAQVQSPVPTDERAKAVQLVQLLSEERADNYMSWMKVGWCLHHIDPCDDMLQAWVDFSGTSNKFVLGECDKLWDDMDKYTGRRLGMGALCMWAKEDDPAGYAQLVASFTYTGASTVDIDTLRQSQHLHSYDVVKRIFERTHFKTKVPVGYVMELDGQLHAMDEARMLKLYRNLFCTVANVKDGTLHHKKVLFIKQWLSDPTILTYHQVDFLPPPLACPSSTYNTWAGFAIDKQVAQSSGNVQPFLDHIAVLMNHDPACIQYFVHWLAQLVQQPGKVPGTAVVLLSREGAGKNIFLSSFADMLGPEFYLETAQPEQDLFGRFNLCRKDKLLIDVDEARGKDTFAHSDMLKNMITNPTLQVEQKGLDRVTMRNCARLVFSTNNELCVKVGENDRRYFVVKCSPEKVGDKQYFVQFGAYMACVHNQKAIMEHLRGLDISGINWQRRPETDTYKMLQGCCTDPLHKYLHQVYMELVQDRAPARRVRASHLHAEFLAWMEKRKIAVEYVRSISIQLFGMKMKNLMEETDAITKQGGGHNYYTLDTAKLKAYMERKGLLNEATAMFIDDDAASDEEEGDAIDPVRPRNSVQHDM